MKLALVLAFCAAVSAGPQWVLNRGRRVDDAAPAVESNSGFDSSARAANSHTFGHSHPSTGNRDAMQVDSNGFNEKARVPNTNAFFRFSLSTPDNGQEDAALLAADQDMQEEDEEYDEVERGDAVDPWHDTDEAPDNNFLDEGHRAVYRYRGSDAASIAGRYQRHCVAERLMRTISFFDFSNAVIH